MQMFHVSDELHLDVNLNVLATSLRFCMLSLSFYLLLPTLFCTLTIASIVFVYTAIIHLMSYVTSVK